MPRTLLEIARAPRQVDDLRSIAAFARVAQVELPSQRPPPAWIDASHRESARQDHVLFPTV